ncbi:glycosyl transferase family group 2-domain-containing protein [Melanogaster broomeanus]|nr:glycosyl transferase family group 2-domain-containing protein [Melanogaster broomeanus]
MSITRAKPGSDQQSSKSPPVSAFALNRDLAGLPVREYLVDAVWGGSRTLKPVAAVQICSAAVHAAFASATDNDTSMCIDVDTKIQVLETISELPRAEKEQCAAFIRDERVVVVWADNFDDIVPLCRDLEDKMIKLETSRGRGPHNDRNSATPKVKPASSWSWKLTPQASESPTSDPEKDSPSKTQARAIRLYAPFYCGCAVALSMCRAGPLHRIRFLKANKRVHLAVFLGSGMAILLAEWLLDNDYNRFALFVVPPSLFCIALFFCLQLVGNVSLAIGPVAQYHENSRYYSAVKPKPNRDRCRAAPHRHRTSVFKESLKETIAPSVTFFKKAIQTYARQGGASSIFVHDDGLQIISEEEREARIAFYANHNIGWVARPKHDGAPGGFKRAGRFKKVSNMNYRLALSLELEKHLKALVGAIERGEFAEDEYVCLEDRALEMAIEETYEESSRKWRPWASNGSGLLPRCGSQTRRVPRGSHNPARIWSVVHVFPPEVRSHLTSPYRRHACRIPLLRERVRPLHAPHQQVHLYRLRWSALQDAAFVDPDDGKKKIWSEANVSEDFDMALRLQFKGYIIRWARYSKGGFKKGVSLTVDDELNRWQKYAYGCNELIFNPVIEWCKKGPISKQLCIFRVTCRHLHPRHVLVLWHSCSCPLLVPQLPAPPFQVDIDGYFLHSSEVWPACTVVFPGLGNLGFTLLEYRLGHCTRFIVPGGESEMGAVPVFRCGYITTFCGARIALALAPVAG